MTLSFCWISAGRSFGDLLAEVQHHDAVGDLHHGRHVVLDQQDGDAALAHARAPFDRRIVSSWFMPANGSSSSRIFGLVASPMAMPSARRWPCGRCSAHLVCDRAEAEEGEDLVGGAGRKPPRPRGRRSEPRIEAEQARPRAQVVGDDDVVAHAHALEDRRFLEGAHHALRATMCGARPEMRSPLKQHLARGRPQEGGDQLEQRRLAGAVRTDDRQDLALAHREARRC